MQVRIRMEIYGTSNPGIVIEDQKTGQVYDPTTNTWVAPDGPTMSDAQINKIALSLIKDQPTRGRWGMVAVVTDDSSIGRAWVLYPFDLPARAPNAIQTLPPVPVQGMTLFYVDATDPGWAIVAAAKV
jgi:hypothetical protein